MSQVILAEGANPSTPSTGKATIHIDASGNLCKTDDAGNTMVLACAGDFTLTIPASGTVALLGVAQTFTGAQSFHKRMLVDGADLIIAAGVVTATHSMHRIDTEASAASDDLDTINGGSPRQELTLEAVSSTRTVVAKHATGNIYLNGSADFSLTHVRDKLMLRANVAGTEWHQVGAGDNFA
jgi:hypothetical protein